MKGKVRVSNLTHDQVRQDLDYNPATGEFFWKISPARNIKIGQRAGSANNKNGYRYIKVGGEEVTEGRLAWFYMTAEWPERRIRYKNGDCQDCRFDNLTMFNGLAGEFDHKTKEGRQAYQNAYRKLTPEKQKQRALRDSFGMSLAEYSQMVIAQNNKCAICSEEETEMRGGIIKALAVDHNHTTGKIRSLLCTACNQGLGKFKDDPQILRKAAIYLEKHLEPDTSVVD